jgi:hypothetical protein
MFLGFDAVQFGRWVSVVQKKAYFVRDIEELSIQEGHYKPIRTWTYKSR